MGRVLYKIIPLRAGRKAQSANRVKDKRIIKQCDDASAQNCGKTKERVKERDIRSEWNRSRRANPKG